MSHVRHAGRGAVFALTLFFASCGGPEGGSDATVDADPGASCDTPSATLDGEFGLQACLFRPGCAIGACHGSAAPRGRVVLTDVAQTCAGLVDGPSHDAPGRVFVVPRDLEASYLLDKIDGAAGIVGDRMPPGGSGRVAITQIGALRSWIADGAVCP